MKPNAIAALLLVFFSKQLFPQDLKITAVYYDSTNIPYKVEQKYVDKDSSLLYVGHYPDGSSCISVKKIKHSDTTIVSEGYYTFGEEKAPLEMYIEKVAGISYPSDYKTNPGTFISSAGYDTTAVVDSIMPYREVLKYIEPANFWDSYKQLHMRLIIEGRLKPDLSKRVLDETINTFYVNNQLVKIEWREKDNQLYAFYTCSTKDTIMTCKQFGLPYKLVKGLGLTHYTTITWNKDSTRINWITKDALMKQRLHLRYSFKDNQVKTYSGGKMVSETEYFRLNDALGLFITDGLKNDAFSSNQLWGFEKYKYKKVTENGHIRTYTYTFDTANRIIEQKQFYDGKPDMRITYNYDLIIH